MRAGYFGVSRDDAQDVASAQFFVNSSLAPVLLLRRWLKSVADVLEGLSSAWWLLSGQEGCFVWKVGCCMSSRPMWASALI